MFAKGICDNKKVVKYVYSQTLELAPSVEYFS